MMPIVPSRQHAIHELLERLGSEDPSARDLAVARLRLLGPRVFTALQAWLPGAGMAGRLEVLRVIDGSPDPRALELALALCGDRDARLAARAAETSAGFGHPAAVPVLVGLLRRRQSQLRQAAAAALAQLHGNGVLEALDPLLELLLDERHEEAVRLLAIDVLASLPATEGRTLLARLAESRSPAIAARARQLLPGPVPGDGLPEALDQLESSVSSKHIERLARVLERNPGEVPAAVRARLQNHAEPALVARLARLLLAWGAPAAIPLLHEALQALAPATNAQAGEAAAWVHQALAQLDSRIALYDLRERLTARPVRGLERLLQAAERVGDSSVAGLLPGLMVETPEAGLAAARTFQAIARRERLRRTSRAFRDLSPRERVALETLWGPATRDRG